MEPYILAITFHKPDQIKTTSGNNMTEGIKEERWAWVLTKIYPIRFGFVVLSKIYEATSKPLRSQNEGTPTMAPVNQQLDNIPSDPYFGAFLRQF
ncbi:MAG TPA: hypothetical protein DCR43_03300 [Bacteroidales bacterium]|nr:MAG: hypothetical protein A2X11_00060 [Bacteroidetes bacterium GWE2_42_24]OFY27802.1 MAG: hypothetical protein A2X09_02840 [Bacteroidetes bacterium GWF2_43_11]HAQ64869.1 hypothetical protein [Bacteroidales bacterium]HBZ66164.1 hypothetical protein [Bacteroidales bacterium]